MKRYNQGSNNPNWKGGPKEIVCLYCGKVKKVNPVAVTKFCSRSCNAKFYVSMKKEIFKQSKPWLYEHTIEHNKKVSIALKIKGIRPPIDHTKTQWWKDFCREKAIMQHKTGNLKPDGSSFRAKRGNFRLENNPNWKNGSSFVEYPEEFSFDLKEDIRKRDNYLCKLCGKLQSDERKENNRRLSMHHIDYIKKNCNENNLLSLCGSCNSKVNNDRNKWSFLFKLFIGYWYGENKYIKNS